MEEGSQKYKLSAKREVSAGDVMHNVISVIDTGRCYIRTLLRE